MISSAKKIELLENYKYSDAQINNNELIDMLKLYVRSNSYNIKSPVYELISSLDDDPRLSLLSTFVSDFLIQENLSESISIGQLLNRITQID